MNTQEILQHYQKIRAMTGVNLPPLEKQAYNLDVSSKTLCELDEVHANLDRFNSVSSWIGYQSGNQHFINEPLVIKQDYGVLLNAELAGANNTSLHVRYNGDGGWIITTYEFSAGNEYVADKIKHIASFAKDGSTTLQYLRFWKNEKNTIGINPIFACFTGFGGKA